MIICYYLQELLKFYCIYKIIQDRDSQYTKQNLKKEVLSDAKEKRCKKLLYLSYRNQNLFRGTFARQYGNTDLVLDSERIFLY